MTVDYDQLVKNYCDGLFNTLRNFTPGPEFLDTWVHDEDHARSIFALFEAAESSGLKALSLTVSALVADQLDLVKLKTDLSELGHATLSAEKDHFLISMRFENG